MRTTRLRRGKSKSREAALDASWRAAAGGEQMTCCDPPGAFRSTACKQEVGESSCKKPGASQSKAVGSSVHPQTGAGSLLLGNRSKCTFESNLLAFRWRSLYSPVLCRPQQEPVGPGEWTQQKPTAKTIMSGSRSEQQGLSNPAVPCCWRRVKNSESIIHPQTRKGQKRST